MFPSFWLIVNVWKRNMSKEKMFWVWDNREVWNSKVTLYHYVFLCFLFGMSLVLFLAIPSSCRLEVLVRHRGSTPLLDAAEALGSQKQCTKQANADTNEEHWPQDAVQYRNLITLHTRSLCICLIGSFGIVIASVFIIDLAIFALKAVHIFFIGPLGCITWLSTAL